MKTLIFTALFFSTTLIYAQSEGETLDRIEKNHSSEMVNCAFASQAKVNKSADRDLATALLNKKVKKTNSNQNTVE